MNETVEVDKEELDRLRENERDLTRRLNLALSVLGDIAKGRGHSRTAIRSWVISLSVPGAEVLDRPGKLDDLLKGARSWQQNATEVFQEAGDLTKLPTHAAVAVLADGVSLLHASLASLIALLEERAGGSKQS